MASQNSKSFCTINTADYLPYMLALNESVLQFDSDIPLNVLVSDKRQDYSEIKRQFPNIIFYFPDDLCKEGVAKQIYNKYWQKDMDAFRWSMKPVFLKYLFQNQGFRKIIYVDNDIHFFDDYHFLFNELVNNNVLLTPHWHSSDPILDVPNFYLLYNNGLYNGGFAGANYKAADALEWWAKACAFICVKDPSKGQFVDQTHLNLLPIYFEGVKILKHRGCNVANWNQMECRRIRGEDNRVLINGNDPIVFIHFTKSTISGIVKGEDSELAEYLQKYFERLSRYGVKIHVEPDQPLANDQIVLSNRLSKRIFSLPIYQKMDSKGLLKKHLRYLAQRLIS
jgi:hypothetical protein